MRSPVYSDLLMSLPKGSTPSGAFSLVGHSFNWSVPFTDLMITDGTTQLALPDAIAKGWVYQVLTWTGSAWVPVDISTASMEPGKSYKFFTSKDNLAIICLVS
jgi:hypothetical protein